MEGQVCSSCGAEIQEGSHFCGSCGQRAAAVSAGVSKGNEPKTKGKIDWMWVLKSSGIIALFFFVSMIIGVVLFYMMGNSEFQVEKMQIYMGIGGLTGIFLGSMLSAYLSPGVTIKEPAIASISVIIIVNVIGALVTGNFGGMNALGLGILFLISMGGAKLGEVLQDKLRK